MFKYQIRVLKPIVVRQTYETASWYRLIRLEPGVYPMSDVSFGATHRWEACIEGIVTESYFENRLFHASSQHKNEDVGKKAIWCEYLAKDPKSFWDREFERYEGAMVIEEVQNG